MKRLPQHVLRSLTWDRGQEMAAHKSFTMATDMAVNFCDPSSPWQRGSNENTNGLLRQYFPKGKGMTMYTQDQLDEIANKLNTRPRKTLGFKTPAEVFDEALHWPLEPAPFNWREDYLHHKVEKNHRSTC